MTENPQEPDFEYIAYIDESGETGLKRVLAIDPTGSSEWFILSLVIVPKFEIPNIGLWIEEILEATRTHIPDLHFANLQPSHKIKAVKILAGKPIMGFVVCSNKKNMRRYRNVRAERMAVPDWFYCWLTRLALERATNFVWRRSVQNHSEPRRLKLVFSERGGLRIGQIGAYYHWIKQQSLNDNLWIPWGDLEWETLHPHLIDKDFHKNLAGLKLADALANSFFVACDNKQSGPCLPEAAKLLKPIMGRFKNNETGRYSGYGVKLLPTWSKAKLTPDQQEIFRFYGYPLQLWQKGKSWELPPPPWERR
ncbi:MAG TPA: DUF3800 domain-containing protein [Rhizomicrobium sp.]|nr:DUF3800 domain-containing protein [Rhizomicrobium sp.]